MEKIVANITGANTFLLLKVLEKMEVTDELAQIFKDQAKLGVKNQKVLLLLKEKSKGKDIRDCLKKDKGLAEELAKIEEQSTGASIEMFKLILMNVSKAEDEIFNCLSKIYKIDVEVLKDEDFDVFGERIQAIINNESFKRFFSRLFK